MPRVPSADDVANLSRELWEETCRTLVALLHQAEGVEDRHGKGNGLDMIRIDGDEARGWQFRRLDDRFEDKQAAAVRDAARLAVRRTLEEDGVPLKRFYLWTNVDPEPGHMGKTGERERVARLKAQILDELGMVFEFVGLTRIRALLLQHPYVRPELFEDLSAQLAALRDEHSREMTEVKAMLAAITSGDRGSAALRRVVEQAAVHFERGLDHGSNDQFRAAAQCLNDALSLLKDLDADPLLEGRVLVALAGIEMRLGNLPRGERAAHAALGILPPDSGDPILYAQGNLALVLVYQQRFDEAEQILRRVLETFEGAGRLLEVVRTLTHLLELELNRHDAEKARFWGRRLGPATFALERASGPSMITLAGRGALASGLIALGIAHEDRELLGQAEKMLKGIEEIGRANGSPHIAAGALAQRAQAVRYQDRFPEAEELYRRAIAEADAAAMSKGAADSEFSLAIVLHEAGRIADALEAMTAARQRYLAIDDAASARDAAESLTRWSR